MGSTNRRRERFDMRGSRVPILRYFGHTVYSIGFIASHPSLQRQTSVDTRADANFEGSRAVSAVQFDSEIGWDGNSLTVWATVNGSARFLGLLFMECRSYATRFRGRFHGIVQQFLIVCDQPLLRKSFAVVTSRYGFIRPTSVRQHSSWPWADVLKLDGQISIVRRLLSNAAANALWDIFCNQPPEVGVS